MGTTWSEILHSVYQTKRHKFLPWKKKGGKKELNEHVLASQINLHQKFKVENNFDLDEMDGSLKKKIIYTWKLILSFAVISVL